MNKIFGVLALGAALLGTNALSGGVAFARQNDDVVARLNAAEHENAAIRKKNAELAAATTVKPASIRTGWPTSLAPTDLPVDYKAPPPVEPGRLTLWGEGGAIWTGGDQVARSFSLTGFTTSRVGVLEGTAGPARSIPVTCSPETPPILN